jgi:hypothetical protein
MLFNLPSISIGLESIYSGSHLSELPLEGGQI